MLSQGKTVREAVRQIGDHEDYCWRKEYGKWTRAKPSGSRELEREQNQRPKRIVADQALDI